MRQQYQVEYPHLSMKNQKVEMEEEKIQADSVAQPQNELEDELETPEGEMLQEEDERVQGRIVVGHNPKVEEVRSQLGDFDYEMPPPGMNQDLEMRPAFQDKKGGTYIG